MCNQKGETINHILRAFLQDPGLDTDPGQCMVEFHVYTSPGWVRVGSIPADPDQFLFRSVERAGNYLPVRKMADEPCNHQFVLTLSAVLPMLFACAQLHGFLILMLQQQQLQATHRAIFFDFNRAATKLRRLNKRRKNRRVWVRQGRTEQWSDNSTGPKLSGNRSAIT